MPQPLGLKLESIGEIVAANLSARLRQSALRPLGRKPSLLPFQQAPGDLRSLLARQWADLTSFGESKVRAFRLLTHPSEGRAVPGGFLRMTIHRCSRL